MVGDGYCVRVESYRHARIELIQKLLEVGTVELILSLLPRGGCGLMRLRRESKCPHHRR